MINITEQARDNMLKYQLRACDILDDHLLDLLANTPRESYVADGYQHLAFTDTQLPVGHGEVMMTPLEEARMLKALDVQASDTILEVGTGSGYVTSLLAKLGQHVVSVDIHADFTERAQSKLVADAISNVDLITADAAQGFAEKGPYDVIAITGSTPLLPKAFRDSLNIGGRLFVILGEGPAMQAFIMTKHDEDRFEEQCLFETQIKPLVNAAHKESFTF
jgi:protein-L-isoaspartate(D-aspartate) O-methyltransferase